MLSSLISGKCETCFKREWLKCVAFAAVELTHKLNPAHTHTLIAITKYLININRNKLQIYRKTILMHSVCVQPFTGTLKPQSNGPLYSNRVIGTLVVDRWAVTFGTARRGLGGAAAHPCCTKCNNPPINGQCTNFTVFNVSL